MSTYVIISLIFVTRIPNEGHKSYKYSLFGKIKNAWSVNEGKRGPEEKVKVKAYRENRVMAPFILNLGTTWK